MLDVDQLRERRANHALTLSPRCHELNHGATRVVESSPAVLFSPEAHEPLVGEVWSAERVRAAIAAIVADAEEAFDDGWPLHPLDLDERHDAARSYRTLYFGGSGVVAALHRLARRDFVELRRDYAPYLEASLGVGPDFPAADGQRSLWMGEVGIRLVLQRLAPSAGNREQLSRLIAAHERDERRELMWGSPGTILAGRELGLDTSASEQWLRGERDADGLWTQHLFGEERRFLGPAHGFAGCVLALGDTGDVAETLQGQAVVENDLVNWPPLAGQPLTAARDGSNPHAVVPRRARNRGDPRPPTRRRCSNWRR